MNAPAHGRKDTQDVTLLRRLAANPHFSHYHRLVLLVFVVNGLLLARIDFSWPLPDAPLQQVLNLTLANLTLAVLMRQQPVINALFWCVTRVPAHWPLGLRRQLAKVYHFGGLHSGCAMAGGVWLGVYTVGLLGQWGLAQPVPLPLMLSTLAMLALVVILCLFAHPKVRAHWHNGFEQVHRLGGWAILLLLWAHGLLNQVHLQGGELRQFAAIPQFWVMMLLTLCVILPWSRLRKVAVTYEQPSPHAVVVHFNHGVTPFEGSSTAISRNPVREWHAFANIPSPGRQGFRLIISRAGDWTGRLIDEQPSHLWVKGIPTAGVARIESLFSSVIYVATGSGIGPVLPHLLAHKVPAQLIWSTRSPRETYGDRLVDEILSASPQALIWDTKVQGKPDLLDMTLAMYHASDAQAVICIANQTLTRSLVQHLERRNIPAYGAIWDS